MDEEKNTTFNYLLNAVMHASQEAHPAKAGYAGKYKALIAHVRELERKAAAYDAHSHTTELLPCPFCNGTPELRETGGWSGIGCNTNKCPAYLHALMFRTPAEAIAAWNRRSYATALCQRGGAGCERCGALADAARISGGTPDQLRAAC